MSRQLGHLAPGTEAHMRPLKDLAVRLSLRQASLFQPIRPPALDLASRDSAETMTG